ncbi:hypothetical protein Poly41_60380 [Novipirellula artificiosorum]|uniref:Uncharacterized protein n=1 Tax=Novipirellula artificiosorum TaxID=2528016 RepID=A0A5C6D3K7_9BACT|nr:hypothetical protein Poly41_60380 [Novipirellula artificiosorum]
MFTLDRWTKKEFRLPLVWSFCKCLHVGGLALRRADFVRQC